MGDLRLNITELKAFNSKLQRLSQERIDIFCRDCAKEITARLLQKVIKVNRTPVAKSVYNEATVFDDEGNAVTYKRGAKKGKAKVKKVRVHTGGTLRRGWTGGVNQSATGYANSLSIAHSGSVYTIIVKNPVEYAPYVEFGHRQTPGRFVPAIGKRLKKGWVDGQFMLTISVQEMQGIMPALLQKRLEALLKEAFRD